MQVTNVNDVRVYNLTCGQKAVPEVKDIDLILINRIDFLFLVVE
jgi:hypothetical protein